MSSHQLVLSPHNIANLPSKSPYLSPIHASFASETDTLAVLWESSRIELWDLHTRLEPGRGKAMAPEMIWSGEMDSASSSSSRQINVTTAPLNTSPELLAQIVVLRSLGQGSDAVTIVDIAKDLSTKSYDVAMFSRNGRLLSSNDIIAWQAPNGQIYAGNPHHIPAWVNGYT